MKLLLRVLMATALVFAGVASVYAPEAAAQQPNVKGKKGGGPGPGHGGSRNRGGKIAGGIAAGIAAGIILNEIAKSQAAPVYDDRLSCRQLRHRCEDGQGWACRKFDRRC